MKYLNIGLTLSQDARLTKTAKRHKISKAELVRRLIEQIPEDKPALTASEVANRLKTEQLQAESITVSQIVTEPDLYKRAWLFDQLWRKR